MKHNLKNKTMSNEIEIVLIDDTQSLKDKLELLVNEGWEIKGVVGYDPHNQDRKPFVILERQKAEAIPVEIDTHADLEKFYTRPEPPRQEISISVG
jgi:hypothetical protein